MESATGGCIPRADEAVPWCPPTSGSLSREPIAFACACGLIARDPMPGIRTPRSAIKPQAQAPLFHPRSGGRRVKAGEPGRRSVDRITRQGGSGCSTTSIRR